MKQLKKAKWELDSPRFSQARQNLGLLDEDLILNTQSEMKAGAGGMDKNLLMIRYNHHKTTLITNLNDVIAERNKIRHEQIVRQAHGGGIYTEQQSPGRLSEYNSRSPKRVQSHKRKVIMTENDVHQL